MGEIILWSDSGYAVRWAVVELCGWVTKKGKITKTGIRIVRSEWADLTPAVRNVLLLHGVKP